MSGQTSQDAINISNLKRRIDQSWSNLQTFLGTLSKEQIAGPRDAAGWTVKDHLAHLAAWENGLCGLLEGHPFREGVGVDQAAWQNGEDQTNAAIQRLHHQASPDEVLEMLRRSHERFMAWLNSATDEDLLRPYRYYLPDSDEQQPVIGWIVGDTYGHYAEHIPWMAAIVARK